jgi:hypothetical protein
MIRHRGSTSALHLSPSIHHSSPRIGEGDSKGPRGEAVDRAAWRAVQNDVGPVLFRLFAFCSRRALRLRLNHERMMSAL